MAKNKKNNIRFGISKMKQNFWFIVLIVGYLTASICLFFYSFFQIDLNLTLINHPLFLEFQKPFIEFGYFKRPESVNAYLVIICAFFMLYLLTLWIIVRKKISFSQLFILVLIISVTLLFSYPASFSHDIFNYMFDARIVTEYGQNPYTHKALDFPSDPWIRFMHWTHRTYPYGPVWLLVTIPLSYFGAGKFLIILILFKILISFAYLYTAYYIFKILQIIRAEYAILGVAFFALNPLVILETLVSAHNDAVMMGVAVFSVYLLVQRKGVASILAGLLSIGVKFTTVYLLPFYVIGYRPFLVFILSLVTFGFISYRIGIQPWYFLWVMPFASLACMHRSAQIVMVCMTFAFLLRYIPFIQSGSWYPSAIPFQYWVTLWGIVVSIVVYIGTVVWNRLQKA